MIKLAKIDIMKQRRKSNIQMERDHVKSEIVVSEDLVVRDVANCLASEESRLCVEDFNKSKNGCPAPFASPFNPKKTLRIG